MSFIVLSDSFSERSVDVHEKPHISPQLNESSGSKIGNSGSNTTTGASLASRGSDNASTTSTVIYRRPTRPEDTANDSFNNNDSNKTNGKNPSTSHQLTRKQNNNIDHGEYNNSDYSMKHSAENDVHGSKPIRSQNSQSPRKSIPLHINHGKQQRTNQLPAKRSFNITPMPVNMKRQNPRPTLTRSSSSGPSQMSPKIRRSTNQVALNPAEKETIKTSEKTEVVGLPLPERNVWSSQTQATTSKTFDSFGCSNVTTEPGQRVASLRNQSHRDSIPSNMAQSSDETLSDSNSFDSTSNTSSTGSCSTYSSMSDKTANSSQDTIRNSNRSKQVVGLDGHQETSASQTVLEPNAETNTKNNLTQKVTDQRRIFSKIKTISSKNLIPGKISLSTMSDSNVIIGETITVDNADDDGNKDSSESDNKISEEINEDRVMDPDCLFVDGVREVDMLLVYKQKTGNGLKKQLAWRQAYEQKLMQFGLALEYDFAKDSNIGCIKIHASYSFLLRMAKLLRTRVPLAECDISERKCSSKCCSCCNDPFSIDNEKYLISKSYIYANYETAFDEFYIKLDNRQPNERPREIRYPSTSNLHNMSMETTLGHHQDEFGNNISTKNKAKVHRIKFSKIQRIRLVLYALERISIGNLPSKSKKKLFFNKKSTKPTHECTIKDLTHKGVYSSHFPLHDSRLQLGGSVAKRILSRHQKPVITDQNKVPLETKHWPLRLWLYDHWARYGNWYLRQPLDEIREYLGEKLGMYFAWLGFYTQMLIIPSILGIFCIVKGIYRLETDPTIRQVCDKDSFGSRTMCRLCPNPTCPFRELSQDCTTFKLAAMFDHEITTAFALFMSIWNVCFLSFWERKQATLACRWDTLSMSHKDNEILRPEFKNAVQTKSVNPVTGKWEARVPFSQQLKRTLASIGTIALFIVVILGGLVGIQFYKLVSRGLYFRLQFIYPIIGKIGASTVATVTGSIMNVLFIVVTNQVYSRLAWRLTSFENPRTDDDFERSYIFKVVLFQFINFYGIILYMALLKGITFTTPDQQTFDQCPPVGCIAEVIIQLLVVMTGKQIVNNCMEIGLPIIFKLLRRRKVEKTADKSAKPTGSSLKTSRKTANPSSPERSETKRWADEMLLEPTKFPVAYGDYLEMIIQFGFLSMFTAAFPIAPVFALLNNIVEIRLDAQKYLRDVQRHMPHAAANIGPWQDVLRTFVKLSIVVNGCLIAFTTKFIDQQVYSYVAQENHVAYIGPGFCFYNKRGGFLDWQLTEFRTDRYYDQVLELQDLTNSTLMLVETNMTEAVDPGLSTEELLREMQTLTVYSNGEAEKVFVDKCYFVGFYKWADFLDRYVTCSEWWYLFVARLAFVVLFEHAVFFLQTVFQFFIPSVPMSVKHTVARERELTAGLFKQGAILRQKVRNTHAVKSRKLETFKKEQFERAIENATRGKRRFGFKKGRKRKMAKTPKRSTGLRASGKSRQSVRNAAGRQSVRSRKRYQPWLFKRPNIGRASIRDPEPKPRAIRPQGYRESRRRKNIEKKRKLIVLKIISRLNMFC